MSDKVVGPVDAIIIGAGVIGAAVGYELAKKGWKTLNIDKNPVAGYGSTSASCAIIRVHYSTYDGCAIAYEGFKYWESFPEYLEAQPGETLAEFVQCGCVVYKVDANNKAAAVIARARDLGVPLEEWTTDQIKQHMPFVDTSRFTPARALDDPDFGKKAGGEVYGAVYFPTAGYVNDPQLSAQNIAAAAQRKGAKFLYNATVAEIIKEGGRAAGVKLADGTEIRAKVVVNVGGPHSSKINDMAGVSDGFNIKVGALKQEVCHVPAPKGYEYGKNAHVVSDSDISVYSRPEKGNFVLIGSEDPECDPRIFVDPDDWDDSFSDQWKVQVYRQAQRYPDLPVTSPVRGVTALYDASDDWIPIYDKTDLPGFYVAIGTSGNQYKNAPVAGKLMAELIEKVEAGHDHDAEPLQFHLENIGRDVSLGFYSRRRQINTESSMSVLG